MSSVNTLIENLQKKLQGRFPEFAARLPGYLQLIRFDKPIGVLLLPGLYYLFARISDGRTLLEEETLEPWSEFVDGAPMPPHADVHE